MSNKAFKWIISTMGIMIIPLLFFVVISRSVGATSGSGGFRRVIAKLPNGDILNTDIRSYEVRNGAIVVVTDNREEYVFFNTPVVIRRRLQASEF